MSKRVPESMIARLRGAIERMEKGPDYGKVSPTIRSIDEAHTDAHRTEASWRESWLIPDLRQLLCYLEGAATAREIEVYGHGYSYGEARPKKDEVDHG